MSIQFSFFIKADGKFIGMYQAFLSLGSLLFLLGTYFTLRQQDTTLISAPGNDSLVLHWWGWLIIAIIALIIFVWSHRKNIVAISKVITDNHRLSKKINPDFPLTSATQLLVTQNKMMEEQISFLFFLVTLCFGWTLVIIPLYLLGFIVYIASFFFDNIHISGDSNFGFVFASLVIWFLGIIITYGFYGLFQRSKEIEILTNKLGELNLDTGDQTE